VTKELKLETNKLARKLGWKGMIIMQIPTIVLGSLDYYLALFIFVWSLLLFANNIEGSWYVKEIGEVRYQQELQTRLKKSKKSKILFGEISYILTFSLAGIFIIVFLFVYNDYIAVFFIALALICEGILATIRSISYLFELKKKKNIIEDTKKESEKKD
jgi:Zn-dependent protease